MNDSLPCVGMVDLCIKIPRIMKAQHLTKHMFIILCFIGFSKNAFSQLSPPKVESVWGGRVLAITGYAKSADTTRLFIATESANSVFYSDIYNPAGPSFNFGTFVKLPSADADNNLGGTIQAMAAHRESGKVFFTTGNTIYVSDVTSGTASKLDSNGFIPSLIIQDSFLVYLKNNNVHWGTLSNSGVFTPNAASPRSIPVNAHQLVINPVTRTLYIMIKYNTGIPTIYKATQPLETMSAITTFPPLFTGIWVGNKIWTGMGISPSGRVFIAGYGNPLSPGKIYHYSDNETNWFDYTTTTNGVSASTFSFAGSSGSYRVYHGDGYSVDFGSTWNEFGHSGATTHPNDGATFVDPNDSNTVYFTTDLAIGVSENGGANLVDIDDGIEAVQVKDFDMTSDKQTAWIASKAGIRKVSKYQTTPSWTLPMFPNGDGSPYYSAAMKPNDTNTVYVGNLRIYKTTDGGANWNQVFTPESAPYYFYGVGTIASAIEVYPYDHNIVFAGFEIQDTAKGGLFFTTNAGSSWNQIRLEATLTGQDVDVTDLAFNLEGTDTVLYVTVRYDLAKPQGYSIYRIVKNGAMWSSQRNMVGAYTSTGSTIVATLEDVHTSYTGDTIYVAGTDAGTNHPVAYYKIVSGANKWTPFTTSGFPFVSGKNGKAVSLGVDTVFVAVDHEIYMYTWGAAKWELGYSYPLGTEINFLYYDELLAGTSTGLYGHVSMKKQPCLPTHITLTPKVCANTIFSYRGKQYTQAGFYQDTVKTLNACDTIISIQLTWHLTSNATEQVSICKGDAYQYPDGTLGTTTETHTSHLLNQFGCDSIIQTQLTVNQIQTTVTTTATTLEVAETGALYQWLKCGSVIQVIPNANAKQYTPNETGSYAVAIVKNGCSDTSTCTTITVNSGIDEMSLMAKAIYPNPVISALTVEVFGAAKVEILDMLGKVVAAVSINNTGILDMAHLPAGMYQIIISTDTHRAAQRIIKAE